MNLWPQPKFPTVLKAKKKASDELIVIAGPCSWESKSQVDIIFDKIAPKASMIRGGVFRAGTYPPKQFGWKMDLLKYAHAKAQKIGKPNVVDVLDVRDLEKIDPYTEVFQIGMRQAQHYALLRELGRQRKPVILKRGSWMTYNETMGALEYILEGGNSDVFLCERGSVTNMQHVRWELSVSTIAKIKQETNIRVIVDSSHGSGVANLVTPLALAGIIAGADGMLIETHPEPAQSLSDANQALSFAEFHRLAHTAKKAFRLVREGKLLS